METFVTILHIIVALILISLVLVQDTKSGSVGGAFGGGGSSSVLGATGATTLAQQMTRIAAVIFAVTSILLSLFAARSQRSVMDMSTPAAQSAPATNPMDPAAVPNPAAAPTATETSTTATAPAAAGPAATPMPPTAPTK